jgi:hypothetical protein
VSGEPRFRLTLRSESSSVPVELRLRRLLKHVLRGLHFRCETLEELPNEKEAAPQCLPAGPEPTTAARAAGDRQAGGACDNPGE